MDYYGKNFGFELRMSSREVVLQLFDNVFRLKCSKNNLNLYFIKEVDKC